MLKVYIGERLSFPHIPILFPNLGFHTKESHLFLKEAFVYLKEPIVEIVTDVMKADYFLVPHSYFSIKNNKEYLGGFLTLAEKYHKKIIIFAYGDSDEDIDIPHSIVFRTSQYGYKKKSHEIIMPAYAEDLLGGNTLQIRHKENIPSVGFCGWASFRTHREWVKYYIKSLRSSFLSFIFPQSHSLVRSQGLHFRKKALSVLKRCAQITTSFIIRTSYSGYSGSVILPVQQLRSEYVQNISSTDFTLVVKGDGNFSVRLYEVLSLGRIPLFINTDCVLPLADVIDYSQFVCLVDYKNIKNIGDCVVKFYHSLTDEEFAVIQKKAREVFLKYLRIDSFFKYVFDPEHKIL